MQIPPEAWLVVALLALLAGILGGKAWERYKLRDGRWIDRRRLRDTPHYMLGLNSLVAGQMDEAIDALSQAAASEPDALELQMILGNLFREKGQVTRAISAHQALLQRADLRPIEHAHVLLCLGLDFRRGGFVDRAVETFREVLRLDPGNRHALVHLQKLHEGQHQWEEAAAVRAELAEVDGPARPADLTVVAFLRNEVGTAEMRAGRLDDAARTFQRALDTSAEAAPAYLNLGDVRRLQGDVDAAVASWEALIRAVPDRAHLTFNRLAAAYRDRARPGEFEALCRRVIAASPHEWRARLALATYELGAERPAAALDPLLDALQVHPHGMSLHRAAWDVLAALAYAPEPVARYVALARDAVFYLDPHVCTRCRYRGTELLWQCPQCHEWNTFVEERMAPAGGGLSD